MPVSNIQTSSLPKDDQPYSIEVAVEHASEVNVRRLRHVSRTMLRDHGIRRASISIAVVDDPTIRKLNREYLQHDYETDVLSFVFNSDETQKSLEGEIIASADTAARVAHQVGICTSDELLLYVVHGMLHLLGYGDITEPQREAMRAAEQKYMMRAQAEYFEPTEESP